MRAALQIEAALRCETCHGEGTRELETCPHEHCREARAPWGCAHSKTVVEACSACEGSGRTGCLYCGDPATLVGANGEAYCSAACEAESCAPDEPGEAAA